MGAASRSWPLPLQRASIRCWGASTWPSCTCVGAWRSCAIHSTSEGSIMRRFWIGRALRGIVLAALAVLLLGAVVMWLWNLLLPGLAGWRPITFGQAVGLLVLSRILFGGIRGRGGWGWRHHMQERFAHLSPEERERFRERLHRCGAGPRGSASQD